MLILFRLYVHSSGFSVLLKNTTKYIGCKGCWRRNRKAYATKGKGKRRNLIRKSEIFLFLFPTLFPTCYNYFGWE